jgi:hypothetical protein
VRQFVMQRGGPENVHARIALNNLIVGQATTLAYADTARFVGELTFLFVPLVLFLRKPKRPAPAADAH